MGAKQMVEYNDLDSLNKVLNDLAAHMTAKIARDIKMIAGTVNVVAQEADPEFPNYIVMDVVTSAVSQAFVSFVVSQTKNNITEADARIVIETLATQLNRKIKKLADNLEQDKNSVSGYRLKGGRVLLMDDKE